LTDSHIGVYGFTKVSENTSFDSYCHLLDTSPFVEKVRIEEKEEVNNVPVYPFWGGGG